MERSVDIHEIPSALRSTLKVLLVELALVSNEA